MQVSLVENSFFKLLESLSFIVTVIDNCDLVKLSGFLGDLVNTHNMNSVFTLSNFQMCKSMLLVVKETVAAHGWLSRAHLVQVVTR